MDTLEIDKVRDDFAVTRNNIFLNTGWSGPSPQPVIEEQKRVLDLINTQGLSQHLADTIDGRIEEVRGSVSRLLGCDPGEIVLTRGVTDGINLVVGGLDLQEGDEVITCNLEHPAGLLPLYNLRRLRNVRLRVLDALDPDDILATFDAAITDKTRLVLFSHVSYSTGYRLPAREICAMARQRGAMVLVDGAQSVGTIPVDVGDLQCDFYAMCGYKWLYGPEATGALYVNSGRLERLAVHSVGYQSTQWHDLEGTFKLKQGADRFESLAFDPVSMLGFGKAVDYIQDIGIDRIEARIKSLAGRLKGALRAEKVLELITPVQWDRSGPLVVLKPGSRDVKELVEALRQRNVITRWISTFQFMRASVNFFNTEQEIDSFVSNLVDLVG